MKNLQKFWLLIIIVVIALLTIGGGVYVYIINNNDAYLKTSSNKQQIEKLLIQKLNQPLYNNEGINVQKENDNYLVGQASVGEGGFLVMAAKVNNEWRLVYTGNAEVNCDELKKYGFPSEFLPNYCTTPTFPIACTMDAKQCPDGSYVGRSGPNCEFVCPINNTVY